MTELFKQQIRTKYMINDIIYKPMYQVTSTKHFLHYIIE